MVRDDPLVTRCGPSGPCMRAPRLSYLPHARQMENLTWCMIALVLFRRKQKVELPMREPSSTTHVVIVPGQTMLDMSSPYPVDGNSGNSVK